VEESCKGIILFHYFVSDVLSGLWLPPLAMGNGGWRWMYFLNQVLVLFFRISDFISFCSVFSDLKFQVFSFVSFSSFICLLNYFYFVFFFT